MWNKFVTLRGKYYKYGVDPDPDWQQFTIGGFESAFLANPEVKYIFEKLHHLLQRQVCFIGTYPDDELIVFHGQQSDDWLLNWPKIFNMKLTLSLEWLTYSSW